MAFKISEKIDRVVTCPADFLVECPPAPISAKVELMRSCNFKCKFCYHSQLPQTVGEMDFGLYKRIVKELHDVGVQELAPFFFGESFLSKQLPIAIEYAKSIGFKYVFLTTNGSVATPLKVAACMNAGLNSLKFSLNHCDEQQFVETTGAPASLFKQTINNIIWARTIRDVNNYDCGLYASYILYDNKQQERMQPILEKVRPYLDEIYALPIYNQASKIGQQEFSGGNQGRADNPVPPIPCWALFRETHINYDGTVCGCSFNVGDEFTMGDLKCDTFMNVWHSPKFRALRRHHLALNVDNTPCSGCIIEKK